jgi:hypothetical protein
MGYSPQSQPQQGEYALKHSAIHPSHGRRSRQKVITSDMRRAARTVVCDHFAIVEQLV